MTVKLNLLIEQLVKLGWKPHSPGPLTTNANNGKKNLVLIVQVCETPDLWTQQGLHKLWCLLKVDSGLSLLPLSEHLFSSQESWTTCLDYIRTPMAILCHCFVSFLILLSLPSSVPRKKFKWCHSSVNGAIYPEILSLLAHLTYSKVALL